MTGTKGTKVPNTGGAPDKVRTTKAPTGADTIRTRVALGEAPPSLPDLATVKGSLTPEQAVEYGVSIGARKRDADRQYGTAMLDAARMWARVQPLIGEGKTFRDQGDYVSALGFSKGYGTRIRRLSVAVESYGMTPESPQWTRVSQDTSSALGELLDARPNGKGGQPSKAQRDRLTKYLTTEKPAGTPKGKGKGKGKTPTPKPAPVGPQTLGDFAAVVRDFLPVVHGMSEADQIKWERSLVTAANGNQKRRAALAAKVAREAEATG